MIQILIKLQINFTINFKSTIHVLTQSLDVILIKRVKLNLHWTDKRHIHMCLGGVEEVPPILVPKATFFKKKLKKIPFCLTLISWFWLKSRNPEIKVPSTPPATAKIWKWKNLKLCKMCHFAAWSSFIFLSGAKEMITGRGYRASLNLNRFAKSIFLLILLLIGCLLNIVNLTMFYLSFVHSFDRGVVFTEGCGAAMEKMNGSHSTEQSSLPSKYQNIWWGFWSCCAFVS